MHTQNRKKKRDRKVKFSKSRDRKVNFSIEKLSFRSLLLIDFFNFSPNFSLNLNERKLNESLGEFFIFSI